MNRHRCECSICTERGDEIERLQEAKRRALDIADERAKEANGLRDAIRRLAREVEMTNKIIEGAKQMVEAHWCDHDLTLLPPIKAGAHPMFDRFSCSKCNSTLYVPKRPGRIS